MARLARTILASLMLLSGGAPVAAADLVAVAVNEPGVCSHSAVLGRISSRFDHQVRHVPKLPQVGIDTFSGIRELRHLPKRHDRPIDRRYCHAKVWLSNGVKRDIWYLVEKPMGFAGIGSNVEFCVTGFDRWHVYGGRCLSVRPPRTS